MAKEVKEEEKRVRKRLPKGRGRHGANFSEQLSVREEGIKQNIEHNCYGG